MIKMEKDTIITKEMVKEASLVESCEEAEAWLSRRKRTWEELTLSNPLWHQWAVLAFGQSEHSKPLHIYNVPDYSGCTSWFRFTPSTWHKIGRRLYCSPQRTRAGAYRFVDFDPERPKCVSSFLAQALSYPEFSAFFKGPSDKE